MTSRDLYDKIALKVVINLGKKVIGSNIIRVTETASTNELAKEYAKAGASVGTVIIAEAQTSGKGRMGRSFFSPDGKGIYMSVVLKPDKIMNNNLMITSFAAVAVARAIKAICGIKAEIKWVNDVYLNEKKVCGILTEAVFAGETPQYIILGIGVNVKKCTFPEEISGIATSVENEAGTEVSKEELITAILSELDSLYETYTDGKFLEESRSLSNVLGKEIQVIRGDETYSAKAVDIDETGGLVIETGGKCMTLYSGEISIRFK